MTRMNVKHVGFMFLVLIHLSKSYDITINSYRVDPATDPNFYNPGTLRITKKSHNELVISGTVEFLQNVGEDIQFQYSMSRKEVLTGRYRKFKERKLSLCEFVSTDTFLIPKLRTVSNIPEPGTCPLPKGRYTIQNYKHELPKVIFTSTVRRVNQ